MRPIYFCNQNFLNSPCEISNYYYFQIRFLPINLIHINQLLFASTFLLNHRADIEFSVNNYTTHKQKT